MEPIEFGRYLRSLREKREITMRKLDSLSGVSHSYISQMERGQRGIPSPDILKKLHKPLGVKYAQLMDVAGYLSDKEVLALARREDEDEETRLREFREKHPIKTVVLPADEFNTDLAQFLQKAITITYNGNDLNDEDRKRILDLLDVLFPVKRNYEED